MERGIRPAFRENVLPEHVFRKPFVYETPLNFSTSSNISNMKGSNGSTGSGSIVQDCTERTCHQLHNNQDKMAMTEYSNNQAVFNCMLNPALKKKKKIPSVLPPPPNGMVSSNNKATTPFWKEPLPER